MHLRVSPSLSPLFLEVRAALGLSHPLPPGKIDGHLNETASIATVLRSSLCTSPPYGLSHGQR